MHKSLQEEYIESFLSLKPSQPSSTFITRTQNIVLLQAEDMFISHSRFSWWRVLSGITTGGIIIASLVFLFLSKNDITDPELTTIETDLLSLSIPEEAFEPDL